jgi:serine/threonine-protein kinase RIO1
MSHRYATAHDNNRRIDGSGVFYAVHAKVIYLEPMGETVVRQSPASKDMSMEAEESTLLEAATKQLVKMWQSEKIHCM